MEIIMTASAILMLAEAGLKVFAGPFFIGEKFSPLSYVINLVLAGATVMVCGRVLGWW